MYTSDLNPLLLAPLKLWPYSYYNQTIIAVFIFIIIIFIVVVGVCLIRMFFAHVYHKVIHFTLSRLFYVMCFNDEKGIALIVPWALYWSCIHAVHNEPTYSPARNLSPVLTTIIHSPILPFNGLSPRNSWITNLLLIYLPWWDGRLSWPDIHLLRTQVSCMPSAVSVVWNWSICTVLQFYWHLFYQHW